MLLITNGLANIGNTLRQRVVRNDDVPPHLCNDFVLVNQATSILGQQSQHRQRPRAKLYQFTFRAAEFIGGKVNHV